MPNKTRVQNNFYRSKEKFPWNFQFFTLTKQSKRCFLLIIGSWKQKKINLLRNTSRKLKMLPILIWFFMSYQQATRQNLQNSPTYPNSPNFPYQTSAVDFVINCFYLYQVYKRLFKINQFLLKIANGYFNMNFEEDIIGQLRFFCCIKEPMKPIKRLKIVHSI